MSADRALEILDRTAELRPLVSAAQAKAPTDQTVADRAVLAENLALWFEFADLEKERLRNLRHWFRNPQFQLQPVLTAIGLKQVTVRNWLTRRQLTLDADESHQRDKWRLFSPRDVLVLAFAGKLSALGFPAGLLRQVISQLEDAFSFPNRIITSNIASAVLIFADGRVFGPELVSQINFDEVSKEPFIMVRLDYMIRETLEPLGVSLTHGNADALRATADRLDASQGRRK